MRTLETRIAKKCKWTTLERQTEREREIEREKERERERERVISILHFLELLYSSVTTWRAFKVWIRARL